MQDIELEHRFIEHLRVERQLSPETLKNYARDLEKVRQELNRLESQSWLGVTDKPLRRAIAELHADGLSGRSLQRMLSALRSFYKYLNREGLARANPALDIKAPKVPRRLPKTLGADSLDDLLDVVRPGVAGDAIDRNRRYPVIRLRRRRAVTVKQRSRRIGGCHQQDVVAQHRAGLARRRQFFGGHALRRAADAGMRCGQR